MKLSDLDDLDGPAWWDDLPPARCERCGRALPDDAPHTLCRAGYCVILRCLCGRAFASFGPVGCPVCSGYRPEPVRRARRLYRRRHR